MDSSLKQLHYLQTVTSLRITERQEIIVTHLDSLLTHLDFSLLTQLVLYGLTFYKTHSLLKLIAGSGNLQLTSFSIDSCRLNQEKPIEWLCLAFWPCLQKLKILQSSNKGQSLSLHSLRLQNFTRLTTLALTHFRLSHDRQLLQLLLPCQQLQELKLAHMNLKDSQVLLLKGLNLSVLGKLDLSCNQLSQGCCLRMAGWGWRGLREMIVLRQINGIQQLQKTQMRISFNLKYSSLVVF